MSNLIAKLSNVSKLYGEGSLEVKALDNLNLEVHRGDYLAVMGASGSGKSTAMNILGCLDRPTIGKYELNGCATEKLNDDELAKRAKPSGLSEGASKITVLFNSFSINLL